MPNQASDHTAPQEREEARNLLASARQHLAFVDASEGATHRLAEIALLVTDAASMLRIGKYNTSKRLSEMAISK